MEKELLELIKTVEKAADAAVAPGGGPANESRCIDCLRVLKSFPVNFQILFDTQMRNSSRVHVSMTTEEMGSDKRRLEIQLIKNMALFECEHGGKQKGTTKEFKCGRCGQRDCTYYQMQTRSADEPMTTYVTCQNCDKKWKFC